MQKLIAHLPTAKDDYEEIKSIKEFKKLDSGPGFSQYFPSRLTKYKYGCSLQIVLRLVKNYKYFFLSLKYYS